MRSPSTAMASGKVEEKNAVGIGLFFRAVRRYPLLAFVSVLVGGSAAAAVWFFLPLPKLTAYAIIRIQAQPNPIFRPEGDEKIEFSIYRQSQTAILKSRLVLNSAVSQPEVVNLPVIRKADDPIIWLENQLKLDFKLGPELMRISLEGDGADESKAIIKAITDAYLKDVVNKDVARRRARMSQLEKIYRKYEETLTNQRARLQRLAENLASTDPLVVAAREKFIHEEIGAIRREQSQLEREVLKMEGELQTHQKRIDAGAQLPVSKELIDSVLQVDASYKQLLEKQHFAEAKLEALKSSLASDVVVPRLAEKQKELERARQDLDEFVRKHRPAVESQLRENALLQENQTKTELQKRIESSKRYQEALEELCKKRSGEVKSFKVDQVGLEILKSEIAQTEKMAERVLAEIETLRPELEPIGRVSMWEEPNVIPGVDGNRRMKYTAMAGLGMLFLGLGLLTSLEYRSVRILHTEEVSSGLGLRVIGTIPALPRSASARKGAEANGSAADWELQLAESADNTRTLLLHSNPSDRPIRTVMVTSAVSGEGKTSLAGHLAVSLARGGFKTLLVDADMRRPSLHRVLGVPLADGLAELLCDEAAIEQVIQATAVAGLWVIPAGLWNSRIPQMLAGSAWARLKARLESQFDHVIVDSPPLLPVADALLLARQMDGVVLSLLHDVSRMVAVSAAKERLSTVGAHIMGVVVNGVAQNLYGTYGDYRARRAFTEPSSRT